jgi:hypothetical protein
MPPQSRPTSNPFAFRRPKPLSDAESAFRTALAEYASALLLPRLQARTAAASSSNRYTGLSVRVSRNVVYLEAVLTNDTEWGGFLFDFARLQPVKGGRYNLSIRRSPDWVRAEQSSIGEAALYFTSSALQPRAVDWVKVGRQKTFEECVLLLEEMVKGH